MHRNSSFNIALLLPILTINAKRLHGDRMPAVNYDNENNPHDTDWILETNSTTSQDTTYRISLCKCTLKVGGHRHCIYCSHITRSTIEDYTKHIRSYQLSSEDNVLCLHCNKSLSVKRISKRDLYESDNSTLNKMVNGDKSTK